MVYKIGYKRVICCLFVGIVTFFSISCNENTGNNTGNTYYIDLVNFTKDSLKQDVAEKLFGKVSFYDNKKLQILSKNYVTEQHERMHYYEPVSLLGNKIEEKTIKIRVEFGGEYSVDSVSYSLQKFYYKNKQWIKFSDMGFLKAMTTYKRAKMFAVNEFGRQITANIVDYSYN